MTKIILIGSMLFLASVAMAQRTPAVEIGNPSSNVDTPSSNIGTPPSDSDDGDSDDAIPLGKATKCKSSKRSCRPSVHHGTGCDGGGCDCKKGEVCNNNPKATSATWSGVCECG